MSFIRKYPKLHQFFAAYFPDADLDNLTDEEVVQNYLVETMGSDTTQEIEEELGRLVYEVEDYWQEIGSLEVANRYFETPGDTLQWLLMIDKVIKNYK